MMVRLGDATALGPAPKTSLRSGDEKCCDADDDDADVIVVCNDAVDVDRVVKYKLDPNAAALTDMNNLKMIDRLFCRRSCPNICLSLSKTYKRNQPTAFSAIPASYQESRV
jgi:hypothetical protein